MEERILIVSKVDTEQTNRIINKYSSSSAIIKLDTKKTPQYLKHIAAKKSREKENITIVNPVLKEKPSSNLYHTPTASKKDFTIRRAWTQKGTSTTPSPLSYDVSVSDNRTKVRQPSFSFHLPEPKSSKHVERKRYWEEKARDCREDHDNLVQTNYSLIRPRVKTVVIADLDSDKKVQENKRVKRILNERRKQRQKEDSVTYNVNYLTQESRARAPVDMNADLIRPKILSKPGVAEVYAERKAAERKRDKFYGPNLPLPWVPDNLPYTSSKKSKNDIEIEDGYESPTNEVMALLGMKEAQRDQDKLISSETSSNYLNSSFSGNLKNVVTAIMREGKSNEERNKVTKVLTFAERNFDYIGSQLQPDWLQNKSNDLRMDLTKSRDSIKIHKKGVIEINKFNDSKVYQDKFSLGPGQYDIGSGFGNDLKRGVAFADIISRDDIVGPFGEAPARSNINLAKLTGNRLFEEEMLDIDYGEAKDAVELPPKNMEFNKMERFPVEKIEENDHLGGTWYKGMAEEIENQRPVIDFSLMTGRTEKERDDELIEKEFGKEEKLQIEVKDWNPMMPRPQVTIITDPDLNPRFPKEIERPLTPPTPTYPRKSEPIRGIDWSKQQGRQNDEDFLDDILADKEELELEAKPESTSKSKRLITAPAWSAAPEKPRFEVVKTEGQDLDYGDVDAGKIFKKEVGNNFGKKIGRQNDEDFLDDILADKEELELEAKPESTSKSKRLITAPAWSAAPEKPRFEVVKTEGQDLDYGDVDAGKIFKKEVGNNLFKKIGRENDNDLLRNDPLFYEEELLVDPKLNVNGMRLKEGPSWGKQKAVPAFKPQIRPKGKPASDIVPPIKLLRSSVNVSMSNQIGRQEEKDVLKNDPLFQLEELDINPVDIRRSNSNSGMAMRKDYKEEIRETIKNNVARNSFNEAQRKSLNKIDHYLSKESKNSIRDNLVIDSKQEYFDEKNDGILDYKEMEAMTPLSAPKISIPNISGSKPFNQDNFDMKEMESALESFPL